VTPTNPTRLTLVAPTLSVDGVGEELAGGAG
jgi:hypothetical protein